MNPLFQNNRNLIKQTLDNNIVILVSPLTMINEDVLRIRVFTSKVKKTHQFNWNKCRMLLNYNIQRKKLIINNTTFDKNLERLTVLELYGDQYQEMWIYLMVTVSRNT